MNEKEGPGELTVKPQLAIGNLIIEFRDILAVGVVFLALGAVAVAIIIAVGFVRGAVTGSDAKSIILGSVGGSAISAVVAAIITGKKAK